MSRRTGNGLRVTGNRLRGSGSCLRWFKRFPQFVQQLLRSQEKLKRSFFFAQLELYRQDHQCLQFCQAPAGNSEKLKVLLSMVPAISLSNVRRYRNGGPYHLGNQFVTMLLGHCPSPTVDTLGKFHRYLPGNQFFERFKRHVATISHKRAFGRIRSLRYPLPVTRYAQPATR